MFGWAWGLVLGFGRAGGICSFKTASDLGSAFWDLALCPVRGVWCGVLVGALRVSAALGFLVTGDFAWCFCSVLCAGPAWSGDLTRGGMRGRRRCWGESPGGVVLLSCGSWGDGER